MRVPKELLDTMRKIVGPENVSDDSSKLREYEQTTLFDTMSPCAVVMPRSTKEVVHIVELANRQSVPLIPVSSGKPRLRGESAPKVSDAIAVEQRRLGERFFHAENVTGFYAPSNLEKSLVIRCFSHIRLQVHPQNSAMSPF